MFLRRLSIQWKITLLAGLCLLGVVALLVGLSVYRMQHSSVLVKSASTQMLDESARLRLEARGELQALRIQRYFMDAFQYGKGFSRQILFLRDQAQKRFLDAYDLREDLTRQVRTALAANPEVLDLYVVFEPNALDGKDELFVDQPALGSNDKGRFSLYWAQATPGQLESESMIESELADTSSGPSGAAYNAWYTCPKESGQPCVLDPYFDKVGERQLLMTSIAFPLELDGKVIGVMGLDINLSNLQALSEQGNRELYDGVGQVGILSPAGLFAGNSRDAGLLGKNLAKADPQHAGELLQLLAAGKSRLFNENDDLKVLQPLQPIPGAKPWGVLLEVPKSALLGPALALERQLDDMRREGTWVELGLGLGAAVLGLLVLWLSARGVTRPILGVAHMLRDIASGEGDLTQRLPHTGRDELGELAGWFNRFLDKLQPIIRDVKVSVRDARSTADQSAAISSQTSAGMQQQFREIDQVATASHEMTATAQDVARSAAQAADAARGADQATRDGLALIDRTTQSIDSLAANLTSAMGQVEQLASSSEEIGSVLEVIRAIAMLEILGKASSINVRKVLWTCAELDLPYRREDWGSGFRDTHAAEFLALNPNAMVPVLRDGELVLWESNSIIRYLANRYTGERLYPQQAAPRARVDQWLDWQASDLNRSWSYAFMSLVRQSPAHRDAAQVEASLRGWTGFMEILEGQLLRTGAYVAGETFSLADIAIGLSVNRWYETPFEHPSLPAVRAYYERLGTRPGFLAHGRNGVP